MSLNCDTPLEQGGEAEKERVDLFLKKYRDGVDVKIKPEVLTVSGNYFSLETPNLSLFGIDDIAHALSQICRFAGHTQEFYSVAQHSVMVSNHVPKEHALAGLLHDAAEAFIGDISTPLKQLLPDYKQVEKRVERAVLSRFGIYSDIPQEVKYADLVMLATERRDLMAQHDSEWDLITDIEPLDMRIEPLEPKAAANCFLNRYKAIVMQKYNEERGGA